MNVYEIISLCGGVTGLIGLAGFILFYKQTKRIKNAEAKKSELDNFERQIDRYESRLHSRDQKVDAIYVELRQEQDKYYVLLQQYNDLKAEHAVLKVKRCDKPGCGQRVPPGEF
ncbi:MAG: hypothetical protein LBV72_00550 [Tannerella sp.]|jgi:chromosome segregation ATPase|nr:hypothetical protein [Tannerella sp.]